MSLFGSDQWNAEVYDSLSVASKVSGMVRDRAQVFRLAYQLYTLNTKLRDIFEKVHSAIENPKPGEPASPEQFQKLIFVIRELSTTLYNTYERAKLARLTNYSLIAGSLSRLHTFSEDLSELADWLEMIQDPNSFEPVFERAKKEIERGEVYDLSQVK